MAAFEFDQASDKPDVKTGKSPLRAPGYVLPTEINSLGKLEAAFSAAGGQPVSVVDGRGKVLCKIFSAETQFPAVHREKFLYELLRNLPYFIQKLGNTDVLRLHKTTGNVHHTSKEAILETVGYVVGNNYEFPKP